MSTAIHHGTIGSRTLLSTTPRSAARRLDRDPYDPTAMLTTTVLELDAGPGQVSLEITQTWVRRCLDGRLHPATLGFRSSLTVDEQGRWLHQHGGHRSWVWAETLHEQDLASVLGTRLAAAAPDADSRRAALALIDEYAADLGAALASQPGRDVPASPGAPSLAASAPLLDPAHLDKIGPGLFTELLGADEEVLGPWLDADNARTVAQRSFGTQGYVKPLARAVARLDPRTLAAYAALAEQLPSEFLAQLMLDLPAGLRLGDYLQADSGAPGAPGLHAQVRLVAAAAGPSMLKRFLLGPAPASAFWADMRDAALVTIRGNMDAEEITATVERTGRKKIRSSRQLVQALAQRAEALRGNDAARTQADDLSVRSERAALVVELGQINARRAEALLEPLDWSDWAVSATRDRLRERHRRELAAAHDELERRRIAEAARLEKESQEKMLAALRAMEDELDGLVLHDWDGRAFTLVVATDVEQLAAWGQSMHNCIYTHYRDKIGRAASLMALVHEDEPVLNLEVTGMRLVQCHAKYNRLATTTCPDEVLYGLLRALQHAGVPLDRSCSGLPWATPAQALDELDPA